MYQTWSQLHLGELTGWSVSFNLEKFRLSWHRILSCEFDYVYGTETPSTSSVMSVYIYFELIIGLVLPPLMRSESTMYSFLIEFVAELLLWQLQYIDFLVCVYSGDVCFFLVMQQECPKKSRNLRVRCLFLSCSNTVGGPLGLLSMCFKWFSLQCMIHSYGNTR